MAIISFSRKFIFIKTRKTAGTSLEVQLARSCGSSDIVTPIFPSNTQHHPRNFVVFGEKLYFNHMTAERVKELQRDAFPEFFKFCFERHPVDKCLSFFAMQRNSPFFANPQNPRTWDEYLEHGNFPVDAEMYCAQDGTLLVDKIYRYEEMDAALREISFQTGISERPLAVREKAGFRYGVPSFADVMANSEQRARIMDAFAPSLKYLPYD